MDPRVEANSPSSEDPSGLQFSEAIESIEAGLTNNNALGDGGDGEALIMDMTNKEAGTVEENMDINLDIIVDENGESNNHQLPYSNEYQIPKSDNESLTDQSDTESSSDVEDTDYSEANSSDVISWNEANLDFTNVPSDNIYTLQSSNDWRLMVRHNLGSTVQVTIANSTFWCIPSILISNCSYFSQYPGNVYYFEEPADLTAVGFRAAYEWMRFQEPLHLGSMNDRIVELLHTAMQLQMRMLELACNNYLTTAIFSQRNAYNVYHAAIQFPIMQPLRSLMLQRVGFYFLDLVAQDNFLQMPLDDVWVLLQDNTLGVNTELEVLYSAIRWLSACPNTRAVHVSHLLRCVRFTRMPMEALLKLWNDFNRNTVERMEHLECDEIALAFYRSAELEERISNAVLVVTMRIDDSNTNTNFFEACILRGLNYEPPREWVYDERCEYHIQNPRHPYAHRVTMVDFMSHLARRMELLQDDEMVARFGYSMNLSGRPQPLPAPSESDSEPSTDLEFEDYTESLIMSSGSENDFEESVLNPIGDDLSQRTRFVRHLSGSPQGTGSEIELTDDEVSEAETDYDSEASVNVTTLPAQSVPDADSISRSDSVDTLIDSDDGQLTTEDVDAWQQQEDHSIETYLSHSFYHLTGTKPPASSYRCWSLPEEPEEHPPRNWRHGLNMGRRQALSLPINAVDLIDIPARPFAIPGFYSRNGTPEDRLEYTNAWVADGGRLDDYAAASAKETSNNVKKNKVEAQSVPPMHSFMQETDNLIAQTWAKLKLKEQASKVVNDQSNKTDPKHVKKLPDNNNNI